MTLAGCCGEYCLSSLYYLKETVEMMYYIYIKYVFISTYVNLQYMSNILLYQQWNIILNSA